MPQHAKAAATLDEIRRWPAQVDIRTAASAIGVSASYLYELVKRGESPVRVIKVGSRFRVPTAAIIALLDSSAR